MPEMKVPFFRPAITEAEIDEVVSCLRSGWLTTGPRVKAFEAAFAEAVGAKHAVALNSCTAALHLALEAVGLRPGELVLVPTFTFAATAEVVRYFDATPVLVDVDPHTLCMDPAAVEATLDALAAGAPVAGLEGPYGKVRALIPVHYGGQMAEVEALRALATARGLAYIEDAAHTLPAAFRAGPEAPWRAAGSTADVTCFSFYANKCITTGEGGMAVTDDAALADRMRVMSLHGMSKDAWRRFRAEGSWYYEIVAPGFKYNLTDIAASIGLKQLERAEALRDERAAQAARYHAAFAPLEAFELPEALPDRQHAWHLYPLRLARAGWSIDRAAFIEALSAAGIGASVHWMPLHLHPYYRETYGLGPGLFPVAEDAWPRLVSLPIFPGMRPEEQAHVIETVRQITAQRFRPVAS